MAIYNSPVTAVRVCVKATVILPLRMRTQTHTHTYIIIVHIRPLPRHQNIPV